MTSIILCDDHPLILRGLSDLLKSDLDIQILATAQDGMEALRLIRQHTPDVALVDISMPLLNGIELLTTLSHEGPQVRVVLLTASISDEQIVDAIAAGAAGIILKESAFATLLHCLQTVSRGGRWLPQELVVSAISRRRAADRQSSPFVSLTVREMEVARLVADGASNRVIAAALRVSEGTVKVHLHSIYSKLDVDNRTAVAIMFTRAENDRVPG